MSDHLAAIMALTPVGVTAYDTDVPERPTFPYVVYRAPLFREDSDALSRARLDVDDYFTVMSCALSASDARSLHARVRAALDRGQPVVAGMSTWVELSATGYAAVDREISPHIFYTTDTYRYRATPTS